MSIFMTLRIALKALNRNKLRTILTMLGMIIGVGAVITMVALGTGARTTIEERVKSAGTNMILVNAGNFSHFPGRADNAPMTVLVLVNQRRASTGKLEKAAGVRLFKAKTTVL